VRSVEESKALNERRNPMVIISTSGMAEIERILHHLKNNIEDPRNTVLIVSWQAPCPLGRYIADGEKQVKFSARFTSASRRWRPSGNIHFPELNTALEI